MDRPKKALCRALSVFCRRLAPGWTVFSAEPGHSEGFEEFFLSYLGLSGVERESGWKSIEQ